VRLQLKPKPDSHSEYMWVNAAGIRRKEHVLIWGGLADEPFWQVVTTNCEKSAEAIVPEKKIGTFGEGQNLI